MDFKAINETSTKISRAVFVGRAASLARQKFLAVLGAEAESYRNLGSRYRGAHLTAQRQVNLPRKWHYRCCGKWRLSTGAFSLCLHARRTALLNKYGHKQTTGCRRLRVG